MPVTCSPLSLGFCTLRSVRFDTWCQKSRNPIMMSTDEYIRKPASGKATDTTVAAGIAASQPAMISGFIGKASYLCSNL